jgi:hemolysin activation/secretion protein
MTTTGQSMAQSIPGSADVSRVQGNMGQTLPKQEAAPLRVEGSLGGNAPAGAENLHFMLKAVEFEGLSVYPQAEIEKLYAGKIGQNISLADVYALADTLTSKYRNDGYILTQVVVPPQTIKSGVVRLRIVEGRINQVRVNGEVSDGYDVIRMYAEQLQSQTALNNEELERVLLLINDLPGVTARGVLSPSREVVGASDLTIFVERTSFDAQVGLDNYGSRYLGRWEATGSVSANSLLGLNELLSINMAYAPSDQGIEPELVYGEAIAQFPIGGYGTKLNFNFGRTATEPGSSLDEFDILGHAKFGGVSLEQPFIRTRDFNLSAKLGFDMRQTETKSNVDVTREDQLSVVRLSGHMDWVDTILNAGITNIDMELAKGVSWLGANDKGDSNMSRPAGDPQFTKVTASVTRLERLINDVALKLAFGGQMSDGPLLSAEEYGVGGFAFGRGYDPSELVGDDGFGASVEVQWSNPVPVSVIPDYSVYGFYDFGRVWNDDASTIDGRAESLASIGIGLRATLTPSTSAGFMLAKPLTRDVEAENDRDVRPFLNFNHRF